jgi:glyoxylase I family protein
MTATSKNTIIKGLGFHHISITTHKLEESIRFYRDLLGMQVFVEMQIGERRLVQLDIGDGCLVELSEPSAEAKAMSSSTVPLNHIGLVVDDLSGTLERVRASGYPIMVEPRETTVGGMRARLAFVKGPTGESIEFMHYG